jgi:YD repeat-containing protein
VNIAKLLRRVCSFAISIFPILHPASPAFAEDIQTTGSPIVLPVYDSIDENGVDLSSGTLRVRSPALTLGTGEQQLVVQLEWTGQSWRYAGVPMINRDGSRYYVTYGGRTREFRNYNSQTGMFQQFNPIDSSSLECKLQSQNWMVSCIFIDTFGDVVVFDGVKSTETVADYGLQTLLFGNLGVNYIEVYPGVGGPRQFGIRNLLAGPDAQHANQNAYVSFAGQQLQIVTPNHGNPPSSGQLTSDHYLRPKNTTQQIIEDSGATWNFTLNGSRDMTSVARPGGLAATSYTYNGDHRVTSATTAAGVWNYSYADAANQRTVTVSSPGGRVFSVTAHKENGYVTQVVDGIGTPLQRTTTYNYDSNSRQLMSVVYPEGNREEFSYDGRGNVTERRQVPKPGSLDPVLTTYVGYPSACTDRTLCNRPAYSVDPEGARTDFAYAPSTTQTISVPNGGLSTVQRTFDANHGQPVQIQYPLIVGQSERRTVSYQYSLTGQVTIISDCENRANCFNAADETRTSIGYINVPHQARLASRSSAANQVNLFNRMIGNYDISVFYLPQSRTITSNGQAIQSCWSYDSAGRLMTESHPASGQASCVGGLEPPPAFNATTPTNPNQRVAPTFTN